MPVKEKTITSAVENALRFLEQVLAAPNCPGHLVVNKMALAKEFNLSP